MFYSYRRKSNFFTLPPQLSREYSKLRQVWIVDIFRYQTVNSVVEFRFICAMGKHPYIDLHQCRVYKNYEEQIMATLNNWKIVNVRLQPSDKPKFDEWIDKLGLHTEELLEEIGGRNYKVSMSWVNSSQAWCVSVSGTKDSSKNKGQTITSWSNDLTEGIAMALYKIVEICDDNDWSAYETQQGNWG